MRFLTAEDAKSAESLFFLCALSVLGGRNQPVNLAPSSKM